MISTEFEGLVTSYEGWAISRAFLGLVEGQCSLVSCCTCLGFTPVKNSRFGKLKSRLHQSKPTCPFRMFAVWQFFLGSFGKQVISSSSYRSWRTTWIPSQLRRINSLWRKYFDLSSLLELFWSSSCFLWSERQYGLSYHLSSISSDSPLRGPSFLVLDHSQLASSVGLLSPAGVMQSNKHDFYSGSHSDFRVSVWPIQNSCNSGSYACNARSLLDILSICISFSSFSLHIVYSCSDQISLRSQRCKKYVCRILVSLSHSSKRICIDSSLVGVDGWQFRATLSTSE